MHALAMQRPNSLVDERALGVSNLHWRPTSCPNPPNPWHEVFGLPGRNCHQWRSAAHEEKAKRKAFQDFTIPQANSFPAEHSTTRSHQSLTTTEPNGYSRLLRANTSRRTKRANIAFWKTGLLDYLVHNQAWECPFPYPKRHFVGRYLGIVCRHATVSQMLH